jgi:hypothetical protein
MGNNSVLSKDDVVGPGLAHNKIGCPLFRDSLIVVKVSIRESANRSPVHRNFFILKPMSTTRQFLLSDVDYSAWAPRSIHGLPSNGYSQNGNPKK